jgi:hypothetical protein
MSVYFAHVPEYRLEKAPHLEAGILFPPIHLT